MISLFLLVATQLTAEEKPFRAGEIQSKQTFHYGKFEAKIYASPVSGVISTMFLFENSGWKKGSIWQELDIEIFGKDLQTLWQSNVHWEELENEAKKQKPQQHSLMPEKVNQWHLYTIEWTEDYVEWFVDGRSFRKFSDPSVLKIINAKPMSLMFNCWSHSSIDWVGELAIGRLPAFQYVDYIKVYSWNKAKGFSNRPVFVDEFDGEMGQWNVSSHSFDGNRAVFSSKNVATKDGSLIMAFSDKASAGSVLEQAQVPKRQ